MPFYPVPPVFPEAGMKSVPRNQSRHSVPQIIARHCLAALWAELRLTPKPGLVDLEDSGAHRDMDKNTFGRSIGALTPFFHELSLAGWTDLRTGRDLLPRLREIGLAAEQAMYLATGGVNTHKGAIFSLGLIAAASASLLRNQPAHLAANDICCAAASLVGGTLTELTPVRDRDIPLLSNGQRVFQQHGLTGARGEAINGFPSILNHALPVLRAADEEKRPCRQARLQALLCLLQVTEDTNLVSRGGPDGLITARRLARECLDQGGAYTPAGYRMLREMNRIFIAKNLSPGGAADLLSVAMALFGIEKNLFSPK